MVCKDMNQKYIITHSKKHLRHKREYDLYVLKVFEIIFIDVREPVIKNASYNV
jgi:beta-lactamase regulating signal transducer with metallopeptidase domain